MNGNNCKMWLNGERSEWCENAMEGKDSICMFFRDLE